MAIRVYKPTSPARRFTSVTDYSILTKKAPERSLTTDLRNKAGRNNTGKITVKKKTKKGTYKLSISVTASGNANYLAATKTVTVTIKVK